ncbi:MAG: hypothetical protein HFE97_01995 [Oscillospiraceae bacterium]|nr:hypothetical protein [Oscillospiraceae bacterium]
MELPILFGVRHLSPAGAWHLRALLDKVRPRLVLVEGPSDLNSQIPYLVERETVPPIAILAYTQAAPVRSILYPFAEYSPEYQAILWSFANGAQCRFIDLPCEVFLALAERRQGQQTGETGFDAYAALDVHTGEDGHETFWERTLEHTTAPDAYLEGAAAFGRELRELTAGRESDWAENIVRESYMRRNIQQALEEGYAPEEIVVVTGSYHVEGLKTAAPMTDEEAAALPKAPSSHTLMPYSYYRLSTRSGYGAGNKAPAYYSLVWEALNRGQSGFAARSYLSRIARFQRKSGFPTSSAQVIEAVRLADSLAQLRGSAVPALRDLRDAAVTCLGEGSQAAISQAVAKTEIGTRIGALPEGVSRTSIQEDFYRQLKTLKLEKYRDLTAQDLPLDLRENRSVKSEQAAFLDLNRSCFLHQLRVLGVSFCQQQQVQQDNATWAEHWILRWTPESEIELVEAALKGDTVAQAASFQMQERVEGATGMAAVAQVIEDAFTCGMAGAVGYATTALQALAVDAASLEELAATAHRLSIVIQYGGIRRLDSAPLEPILQQIYLRCCLILPNACLCDDAGAQMVTAAMEQLNSAVLAHDFLADEGWLDALDQVAGRDDLNTKLSGFAAAILLERGAIDSQRLSLEVQRRLSRGVPADLGAGWFEGLAMKNRYALIARLSLWESLSGYLDDLDDEEFKRALVFLRRAFADFSAREKDEIAENLGEIWGLNGQQVSEAVNAALPPDPEAQAMLDGLDDFDFDL